MAFCAGLAVHLHGVLSAKPLPQCRVRPQVLLSLDHHRRMDISESKQAFWE